MYNDQDYEIVDGQAILNQRGKRKHVCVVWFWNATKVVFPLGVLIGLGLSMNTTKFLGWATNRMTYRRQLSDAQSQAETTAARMGILAKAAGVVQQSDDSPEGKAQRLSNLQTQFDEQKAVLAIAQKPIAPPMEFQFTTYIQEPRSGRKIPVAKAPGEAYSQEVIDAFLANSPELGALVDTANELALAQGRDPAEKVRQDLAKALQQR